MNTMLAAFWHGPGDLRLETTPIPQVRKGEILIRVQSCAICGSDLRIYQHGNNRLKPPQIIGHEVSGTIADIGQGVSGFSVGEHVSIGADVPCGDCLYCQRGIPNCCVVNYAIGYQFQGGFAEYLLLDPLVVAKGPIKKFSSSLSFDEAALGEPLACCINGYEVGLMQPGKSVCIFGAGPIGYMLASLAGIYEASQTIVVDISEQRLSILKKFLPNIITIDASQKDPVKTVMDLSQNLGIDLIFTACPAVETHRQAIAMVGRRGVVNFFGGLPKSAPPIEIATNDIHYRETYLTGSHGSTPRQHAMALMLLEEKKILVDAIISKSFSLKNIHDAFAFALSKDGLKVVIKPHGQAY